MKNYRTFIGLALILFVTSAFAIPAHAIGIFGQWQDSDGESGYGLGLKQDFSIIPIISIETRISWLRYSNDLSDLDMFPLEVFGKAKLGIFYGGVGLGYYMMSGDFAPKNSFGGFAALGLEFDLSGLGAFVELRYLYLEPDFDSGGTVEMSGIGANVGVSLPF